ncbi:DUF2797 domain-containing protein [Glaciecola sp. XM2]|uniref:DUF2797 domain-containing protein n=1 Tax=Glaciecola sp. XM2 TaxID=1914931 RepID=UPI001BDE8BE5|nr:DUF2797 domain-containing protein [Glaciecola sp. XM2]MBT1452522.1 DUF2797 domain-containing protein [Glaciecola sp. XM2]
MVQGGLSKMRVKADEQGRVSYVLPVGDNDVEMNPLIGRLVKLESTGVIKCVHCDRVTKKSFNQGYCYPCLISLAQCDSCIIKPEQCHYHEGTCREPEWGEAHCLQSHFVYLANTGAAKVGITRHAGVGISSRWIDQGASAALPIFRVSERKLSGLVETALAKHISDKTNWRVMLKGEIPTIDLAQVKQELLEKASSELLELEQTYGLQAISAMESEQLDISYPVTQYPEKIKSINLDKTPEFSGTLLGIKGQYWMLDGDRVINMRKYAGYQVSLSYE